MDLLRPIRESAFVNRIASTFSRRLVDKGLPANVRAEKLAHFQRAFAFFEFNGIQGDILEFGVSTGRALALIERCAKKVLKGENAKYRLFGFDSFEGLPEPEGRDKNVHVDNDNAVSFDKGRYAAPKDVVLERLRKQRADMDRIHLIEGWYDKVLTAELRESLGISRATLIDIDCDFYDSTRVALDWCEPLIRQGTIINFDDWYCYEARQDHGERAAFAQFLDDHPDMTAEPFSAHAWCSKSFLIHRK